MSAWFGDDAPLTGSWLAVPVEVVDHLLTVQPAVWPRWAACLDLRRAQDLAIGKRTPFPSRREFAKKWGWDGRDGRPGEGAVRGLLQAEAEWADPEKAAKWALHPASGAALKAAREAKKAAEAAKAAKDPQTTQPSANPAPTQPEPSANPAQTVEAEKVATPEPSANPAPTQPEPTRRHTRVGHNTPLTSHSESHSPQPPAPRGASDRLVEVVLRSLLQLAPLRATKEAGFRARLEAGDDRDICKWLWDRLEAANQLPTRTRAAELGDAAAVAVHRWVRERGWEPIPDDAPDPEAPRQVERAPREPDTFLEPLLADLANRIRPEDVDIWFRDTAGRLDGDTLRITVPNEWYADWIREHYDAHTTDAARQVYGAAAVVFEVEA